MSKAMITYQSELDKKNDQKKKLNDWCLKLAPKSTPHSVDSSTTQEEMREQPATAVKNFPDTSISLE